MEVWNVGCSLYGFWASLLCLFQFVNTVVWRRDAINRAPIWCDIGRPAFWDARSVRVTVIGRVRIIAAALVIARRLSVIATGSVTTPQATNEKRMVLVVLVIGLSFPAAQLVIFYFEQGHRFNIYEGVGCVEAIPDTILFLCLTVGWPIPIGLVSAFYCVLTLRAFIRRRRVFESLIVSNENLTYHRYFRLIVICMIEILCMVPLCTFIVVYNAIDGRIYKYKGFAELHSNFNRVDQYPALLWTRNPIAKHNIEINQWILIGCSLLYFAIFGLTEEARKNYRAAFNAIWFRPKTRIIGELGRIQREANPSSLIFAHTHHTQARTVQNGTWSSEEGRECSSVIESRHFNALELQVADKPEDDTVDLTNERLHNSGPAVLDISPDSAYHVTDVARQQV